MPAGPPCVSGRKGGFLCGAWLDRVALTGPLAAACKVPVGRGQAFCKVPGRKRGKDRKLSAGFRAGRRKMGCSFRRSACKERSSKSIAGEEKPRGQMSQGDGAGSGRTTFLVRACSRSAPMRHGRLRGHGKVPVIVLRGRQGILLERLSMESEGSCNGGDRGCRRALPG